jgi:RNA polymerase sigma-70 factor (ECF subfamily)
VVRGSRIGPEDRMQAGAIELDQRAGARAVRPTAAEAERLFEAYAARVRGYVAFRVREPADVDDLTGEVFRRVVSGPVPGDPGARPAWLFRVAHNVVVDHYRRRRFPDPLGAILDRPDDAPSLPDAAVRSEQLRAADAALRGLPGRQRAAVYLRHYEGLDYTQVATILDVPESTARSLVHRGLRRVVAELERQEVR